MNRRSVVEAFIVLGAIVGVANIVYQLLHAYGGLGWIATGQYPERWIITGFVHTVAGWLSMDPWRFWWLCTIPLWWVALLVFKEYLRIMGVSRDYALIGSLLPLFSWGLLVSGFGNVDALIFLAVTLCFIALQTRNRWVIVGAVGMLALVLVLNPPVQAARPLAINELIGLVRSIHVFGVLAIAGLYYATRRQWLNFVFLPCYVGIAIIAVDWFRWVMLAAPIWVPLVLNLLNHTVSSNTVKGVEGGERGEHGLCGIVELFTQLEYRNRVKPTLGIIEGVHTRFRLVTSPRHKLVHQIN